MKRDLILIYKLVTAGVLFANMADNTPFLLWYSTGMPDCDNMKKTGLTLIMVLQWYHEREFCEVYGLERVLKEVFMQYRNDRKGNPISILGYGCMRFTFKYASGVLELSICGKLIEMRKLVSPISFFDMYGLSIC